MVHTISQKNHDGNAYLESQRKQQTSEPYDTHVSFMYIIKRIREIKLQICNFCADLEQNMYSSQKQTWTILREIKETRDEIEEKEVSVDKYH